MTNILKQNGDTYINPFPISINPYEFLFNTEEELANWRNTYKIPDAASAEEAFYLFSVFHICSLSISIIILF